MVYYLNLLLHGLVFIEINATPTWLDSISVICINLGVSSRLIGFDGIASDGVGLGQVHRTFVSLDHVYRLLFWL
jgi:hypothetical protein